MSLRSSADKSKSRFAAYAKMAEALVSLTAFLKRMAADQDETVAEPIDVAILSKGDGFIWVKHKDLIRQAEGLAL
jgi:hypothetical protein